MIRNGLPTIIAVFLALAFIVRLESTLQAQGIFYYNRDPLLGGVVPIDLGNTATINLGPGGTVVTNPGPGWQMPTEDQSGVVFWNYGYTPSYINAQGGGAIISTNDGSPAIMNGNNTISVSTHIRVFQVEVRRTAQGYEIHYGYRFLGDFSNTFYPLPYDELPLGIRNYELPPGNTPPTLLWNQNSPTPHIAYLPAGYGLLDIDGSQLLNVGDAVTYPYYIGFSVSGPGYDPTDPTTFIPMIPAPTAGDSLDWISNVAGERTPGNLTINQRDIANPKNHRFDGDNRTLIQSSDTAIANYDTLTVNDSRIEASNVGISHLYSHNFLAGSTLTNFAPDVLLDITYSIVSGPPSSLILNNTQIGTPGGGTYFYVDPITGLMVSIPLAAGIAVYDTNGKGTFTDGRSEYGQPGAPLPTTTRIFAGDKITSEGVNSRIVAGHNVDMSRYPIGSIEQRSASTQGQNTINLLSNINGPAIGIHADPYWPSNSSRIIFVYENSRYWSSLINAGMLDRSGGYYGSVLNHIQLNDNSWIFANTGIGFGNVGGSMPGEEAIRITIDNKSGIYAGGYGSTYYYDPLYGYYSGLYNYGGTGITDRYSLFTLLAQWSAASHDTAVGAGYSGSFHEIHVNGKVIAGAPSRAGIQLRFGDVSDMSPGDLDKLSRVYYHDPYDEYADRFGNVYYYDPDYGRTSAENAARNAEVAARFIAYNTQPNRVFWLKIDGLDSVPLTYYDYNTQRWTVHPDAPQVRINSGLYNSRDPQSFFVTFDTTSGLGIDIVGTSMAYEGVVTPPNPSVWSTYYGPTVREITALGNDALITGGNLHSGGAAMMFGSYSHVAKVIVGENNDVKNLSDVLYSPNFSQSAKNFQAFDMMTSVNRSKFLFDPNLLYNDNGENFHFDNSGVHGDIVSYYNPVAYLFGGSGTDWSATLASNLDSFWAHSHPGTVWYNTEVLDIGMTSGAGLDDDSGTSAAWNYAIGAAIPEDQNPSYLVGHRDNIPSGSSATANGIPGRSLVLNEVFLNFLAGNQGGHGGSAVAASLGNSYGFGNNPSHFREALARFLHLGSSSYAGLSEAELMAGYTRDGTLVVFTNGDIFSHNIYGSGIGDQFVPLGGSIDLRFVDGTTIFNRNIIEIVDGSDIHQYAGIRVRDVFVEKTGHLLLNDSWFSVNPFLALTGSPDYADRLITHDVLNEGIVSGNGMFEIAQRSYPGAGASYYYAGYFLNRGILAPGLPGYIGENEWQARDLEQTAYKDMLKTVSQSSGDKLYQQLMRGVPGGQYGTIQIFGHLYLLDEITRPVYDSTSLLYNTDETISAGQYHATIGNDTIASMFGKYVSAIAHAKPTFDPVTQTYAPWILGEGEISQEDWKVIAMEKLGTHLSWFSVSAMVDKHTGLPLLTQYEQFEYLTDANRRTHLQRKMLASVLSPQELHLYDTNPAERARLNDRIFAENNIRFEFTQLDQLLWRYGFSDVVSVHGTIPPYFYSRPGWLLSRTDLGSVSPFEAMSSGALGITQLGGIVQADRIYDMDEGASQKEKLTSYIIIASEGYVDGSTVKAVTSATSNWVFANVDLMPVKLASGQTAAVLTVIDDPNYYYNRVSSVGSSSFNAKSVASALDNAMFTNPGLAMSFQFGLNSPEVLNDTFRQVASSTRANSLIMNLWSPSDNLFNQIGYGTGGMSTGRRGDVVFRDLQTGRLSQPYGQPAVPPPGQQFAPPMAGKTRGQSPFHRTGSVWGAYTHSTFLMGDDDNSFKYNFHRNGVMIGNEWNLSPSSVLGGVAMLNDGVLNSAGDKVKSADYSFGVYFVTAPFQQFEVKSYLGGGYQSYKTDRYIHNSDVFIGYRPNSSVYGLDDIFGINDHYDSETHGYSFNYAVEFARPFTMSPNFVIRPIAGFEHQNVMQKGYAERMNEGSRVSWSNNGSNVADFYQTQGATSGTYGMSYKQMDFSRSLVRLGFNTESYFARGGTQFRLYYAHRFAGNRFPVSEQFFTSGSAPFQVRGADLGTGYVQVGLGSHWWLNRDRTASFFARGDWHFSVINRGYSMINLNIGLQQNF